MSNPSWGNSNYSIKSQRDVTLGLILCVAAIVKMWLVELKIISVSGYRSKNIFTNCFAEGQEWAFTLKVPPLAHALLTMPLVYGIKLLIYLLGIYNRSGHFCVLYLSKCIKELMSLEVRCQTGSEFRWYRHVHVNLQ